MWLYEYELYQGVSCVDVNTQFIGLSRTPVIFGESVHINMWPFTSPDQVSLEHQSQIHCLFNNGQQDANKLTKLSTKITGKKRETDAVLIIR